MTAPTLDILKEWIDALAASLRRLGRDVTYIDRGVLAGDQHGFYLVTGADRYAIFAQEAGEEWKSYLGAQGSRLGGGGRDLADGPLNRNTWDAIVADVLAYETRTGRFAA